MEKIQQFKKSSSWRDDTITIKPGAVSELDFIDTTPNLFVCQNTTNETLHISIGSIPTLNNYEFKVGKNSVEPFGRPTPTRKIYVYNAGGMAATVKIFSIQDTFDLNILKNFNMSIDGGMNVSTDGIVRGFQAGVSLPAGNNKLGSVEIDDTDMVLFQTIGENIDNIDTNVGAIMVNVAANLSNTNKMVEDVAEIVTALSNLSVGGGGGSDKHLYYINGDCYDKEPVYVNGVDSIEYAATDSSTIYFNYLLNDGSDVEVKINDTVVLSVYSGEQITDISFNLNSTDTITVSGEGANIRAKYFIY